MDKKKVLTDDEFMVLKNSIKERFEKAIELIKIYLPDNVSLTHEQADILIYEQLFKQPFGTILKDYEDYIQSLIL